MDQLRGLSDSRLMVGCAYCGGADETRDHVPSRVFLDAPFPENLPVVPACLACNRSFSLDEEYVACLIEVAVAGSTDPSRIRRESIAKTLSHSPSLRLSLERARTEDNGEVHFAVDEARVMNVMLKLARGHAAFELGVPRREPPTAMFCLPIHLMTDAAREDFNAAHVPEVYGEVGSRGFQRAIVTRFTLLNARGDESTLNFLLQDWLEVQEERYRYLAVETPTASSVKFVIGEYLACGVEWAC